jgi:hypothetical protein
LVSPASSSLSPWGVEAAGEPAGHVRVAAVGGPDRGVGDDLGVRVDRDVALAAVELA